jgi:hypothetical protein
MGIYLVTNNVVWGGFRIVGISVQFYRISNQQTGYLRVYASGQHKRLGIRPHPATCHCGTGIHLPA